MSIVSRHKLIEMKLQENHIYHMDCLEGLKQLRANQVNMVFTSPPYAEQRKHTYGGVREEDYVKWFLPIATEIKRVLHSKGSFFLNIKEHSVKNSRSLYVIELVQSLCKELGFLLIDTFCWTKNSYPVKVRNKFKNSWEPIYHFAKQGEIAIYPENVATPIKKESIQRAKRGKSIRSHTLNGSGMKVFHKGLENRRVAFPSNHLHLHNILNQYSDNRWHPAVFPITLPTFFIKAFTKPGALVVDPFAGTSTTMRACIRECRNFIGFETVEEYYQKSLLLIEKETKAFNSQKVSHP